MAFKRVWKNTSWGGHICICNGCGIQKRCTPQSDFYVRTADIPLKETNEGAPLYCERCVAPKHKFVCVKQLNMDCACDACLKGATVTGQALN